MSELNKVFIVLLICDHIDDFKIANEIASNKKFVIIDEYYNLKKITFDSLKQEKIPYILNLCYDLIADEKVPFILMNSNTFKKDFTDLSLKDAIFRVFKSDLKVVVLEPTNETEIEKIEAFNQHELEFASEYYMFQRPNIELIQFEIPSILLESLSNVSNFETFKSITQERLLSTVVNIPQETSFTDLLLEHEIHLSEDQCIGHVTMSYSRESKEIKKIEINRKIESMPKIVPGLLNILVSENEDADSNIFKIMFISIPELDKYVDSGNAHITINPGIHPPAMMIDASRLLSNREPVILKDKKDIGIEYRCILTQEIMINIERYFKISDRVYKKKNTKKTL